jgi:VanZ family protein
MDTSPSALYTNNPLDRYHQPVNRRPALFLLLYVAVILYLSLYPWRFIPNGGPKALYWGPLVSRRMILDAVLNVVFYVPLGAAAFASFRGRGAGAFLGALALGSLVSLFVETAQLFIPTRSGNLTDLLSNSAGTLLGVVIATTSRRVAARLPVLYSPDFLLVGLWAIWQAFIFLPRYGPAVDVSQEVLGLLILALLAARRQFRIAPVLLLIWLAFEELRPFQFRSPPQPFSWLPFESWFVGALESYYGIIFGKLFLYTAILRVERRGGMQWIPALAAPGAILFAGELAQRYLPARTPEITDVVLLLAGAVMLYLVEPSHWDNKGQT